jgi:thioredoxin-like negative regulator of GroEL
MDIFLETISDDEFSSVVQQDLVLIQIGAEWCPPCHEQRAILERDGSSLQSLYPRLRLYFLDADTAPMIMKQFHVSAIPVIILASYRYTHMLPPGRKSISELQSELTAFVRSI